MALEWATVVRVRCDGCDRREWSLCRQSWQQAEHAARVAGWFQDKETWYCPECYEDAGRANAKAEDAIVELFDDRKGGQA